MIVSSDIASVSVSPVIVSEALSLLKHGKGDGSNLLIISFFTLKLLRLFLVNCLLA